MRKWQLKFIFWQYLFSEAIYLDEYATNSFEFQHISSRLGFGGKRRLLKYRSEIETRQQLPLKRYSLIPQSTIYAVFIRNAKESRSFFDELTAVFRLHIWYLCGVRLFVQHNLVFVVINRHFMCRLSILYQSKWDCS